MKPIRLFSLLSLMVLAANHRAPAQQASPTRVQPGAMPRVGQVSDRFQSYNVEMVEVTGGRFWKPYDEVDAQRASAPQGGNQPTGVDPSLFQYRPPIDLASAKLRRLATALSPAYVRVSGTWQNTTYFHNSDAPAPATPPEGFSGVLTRSQWKGVIDFAKAVDAKIVTSVATSPGARDAQGVWKPDQAREFFAYTRQAGGEIAATEFMNEPSFAQMGGAPKGYDGAAFGRDVAVFNTFLRKAAPGTLFLGPGSVGEGVPLGPSGLAILPSADMLKTTGPVFDVFSYHFYGGVSSRCAATMGAGTGEAQALSADWLNRTDLVEVFYGKLRDQYLPGKELWLTETGETACGGDRWASTFLDSFRYLNQLGILARRGVSVVAHNTLAASDYALLDPRTLDPRPNYWSALLWRRLMGTTVLDAGTSPQPDVYLYAHCLRGTPRGVALLVLNAGGTDAAIDLPQPATRYELSAASLTDRQALLNGKPLILAAGDDLPPMNGVAAAKGSATLPSHTVTFLAFPKAANAACR